MYSALKCKPGFSSIPLPRVCDNGSSVDGDGAKVDCPTSPYVVLGDYCKFVDQQSLKLQENPETVPTGEMPRHVLLFSERQAYPCFLFLLLQPVTMIDIVLSKQVFGRPSSARNESDCHWNLYYFPKQNFLCTHRHHPT